MLTVLHVLEIFTSVAANTTSTAIVVTAWNGDVAKATWRITKLGVVGEWNEGYDPEDVELYGSGPGSTCGGDRLPVPYWWYVWQAHKLKVIYYFYQKPIDTPCSYITGWSITLECGGVQSDDYFWSDVSGDRRNCSSAKSAAQDFENLKWLKR
jgi:hypothetical protein